MEGGKRKPSSWNLFVKKVFFEGKANNKNYSFKQALTDASKLKEQGKMDSKKMVKSKKNMKGGFDMDGFINNAAQNIKTAAEKAKEYGVNVDVDAGKTKLVTKLENYIRDNNINTNMSLQDALNKLKEAPVETTGVAPTPVEVPVGGSHHKKSKRKGKKAKKNTQKRR